MSFRVRLFFIFLVYGLLLAAIATVLVSNINKEVVEKESLKNAHLYAKEIKSDFYYYIRNSKAILNSLRESSIFQRSFENAKGLEDARALFLDIARTSPNIMQLRYIDVNGDEIIRIERNNLNQEAYATDAKYLQNKRNRYYFKEIQTLRSGNYWFSNLDLNIEHGSIEEPIKPVLRMGTPYFYKGEKKGILIINIFMSGFLQRVVASDIYNIYLLDKDNYILVNTKHTNEWSKYLHTQTNRHKKFNPQDDLYAEVDLDLKNGEGLKVVVVPDSKYIQAETKAGIYKFLGVVLIVLFLSFPLSYIMSMLPAKLKSKVDELNEKLEKEAGEREVLLSLFDNSNAVLFKWNNDPEWSVSFVSRSIENLLHYSQEDFATNKVPYASCIHKDDLARVQKEVQDAIESKVYFFRHQPYRVLTKEQDVKWILDNTVIVRNNEGDIINFVGYLTEITDLKRKELELENLARIDQLTGIYNRLHLDEVLLSQYYRFNRYSEECSIILVDIDFFKEVNDSYGHLVGDKVLQSFAKLLKNSLRSDDIIGRWGGEEFLIVLPHTSLQQAAFLAEKLCKKIAEYDFETVGHKTASFGVATFTHGKSIEQCVDMADEALYEAKRAGRNQVKVAK